MDPAIYHFDTVTLLITHYNRSRSLERLLASINQLHCSFAAVIVSDDCSSPQHQQRLWQLREQYGFSLLIPPTNGGLGNNINKGQDAVKTPYTLYIQEDFVPKPSFVQRLQESLTFMNDDQALDLVRFYSYLPYPYVKPYKDGFSEVVVARWGLNYKKIYAYSDHPHLRRSSFLTKFGRYAENMNPDKTEYRMCISFFQKKGKALTFNEYKNLLSQENNAEEPSTVARFWWQQKHQLFVSAVRHLYRQVKYNYDIQFMRLTSHSGQTP
jgi:glycosyltransferase involved in cell wall biosynthesis